MHTPALSGEALNQAIAAQPFEKVTPDSIKAKIDKVEYLVMPGTTVTLCNITMKNGYSVRGESACVDPRNFNEEIGKGIAYKQAFDKLWPLEGYLLAEKRSQVKPALPNFRIHFLEDPVRGARAQIGKYVTVSGRTSRNTGMDELAEMATNEARALLCNMRDDDVAIFFGENVSGKAVKEDLLANVIPG